MGSAAIAGLDRARIAYILCTYTFEVTTMKTAKLFRNGQSQAVRLPKEFRFEGDEVFIKKSGSAVVLIPLVNSWDSLIGSLDKFTKDYMADRDQPKQQKREAVFE
jgi:antitoxin VapB